jgi:hypothetical protein
MGITLRPTFLEDVRETTNDFILRRISSKQLSFFAD